MDLEFYWIGPGEDLSEPFAVRYEVFIGEQGFDPALETDAIDPTAHHLLVRDAQGPVATGRIFPDGEQPGTYHIGRVAVARRLRGTGLGRELMLEMERKAGELGATRATLGAQRQAEGFYATLGYRPYGEEYLDEHCPHIHMDKAL